MKKLYKGDGVYEGCLQGIGEYFEIDPLLLRIVFVIFALYFTGPAIIAYVIAMFYMQDKE